MLARSLQCFSQTITQHLTMGVMIAYSTLKTKKGHKMRLRLKFGDTEKVFQADSASDFIRTVQETSFIPGEGESFRKQLAMAASLDRVTCVESFRFHNDEVLMEDFIKAGFLEICDAEAR